ncbi:MAG: pyridoxal phosphate-dependent aminotransferase [Pseudomonadota bacterium]
MAIDSLTKAPDVKHADVRRSAPKEQNAGRLSVADRTDALMAGSSNAWAVHEAAVARQRAGEEIIVLTIGDPDFDTPVAIVDAAIQSLRNGETHYTATNGIPELRHAIRKAETTRLSTEIALDRVTVVQGAQNGLYAVMQTIANPGDDVLSIDPAYPTFGAVIGAAGGRMVRVPLAQRGDGFRFDVAAAEAAITPQTSAFLFNFPHNPTGAALTRDEAEAVVDLCRRRGIWLICDEVYAELTFDAPYVSPLSLEGARDIAISVRSMSKSHAMTGWRVGWTIAPEDHAVHIQNAANAMLFGGAEFIQKGAVAGLELSISEEMRVAYQKRRDVFCERVAASAILKVVRPESGIFVLVDVRGTGLDETEFAWRLLKEKAVSALPAASFSELTAGFVRISLCAPDAALAEAADRMAALAAEVVDGG